MCLLRLSIVLLALAPTAFGQASRAFDKPNQIVTQEVVISGTSKVDSQQLQDISNSLSSLRIRDDEHEIKLRIQSAFQDMGYFDAEVTNLKVRALDPLARPKPVRVEADVTEGPHYKFGAFQFTGNSALSSAELTGMLPLHVGEFFSTGKVRSGLTSMRDAYFRLGYLNFTIVPATEILVSAQIKLTFDITEGPQFRMGTLEISDKSDNLGQIQQHWPLRPGEPFDADYLDKFVHETREFLPSDFQQSRDLEVSLNCNDTTVLVRLNLDGSQNGHAPLHDVDCDKEEIRPIVRRK